jgi:hypothetical protein
MPLDHFVSQVHLKQFYSPALDGKQMYGFRKRDGYIFPCRSKDVCRVENGSTNSYLMNDRAVEEFLTTIEPRYNQALVGFRTGRPSPDDVYAIAGFVAYVTSCSPTAMRLGVPPLQRTVETTAEMLDAEGELPETPAILGQKSASELIRDGVIKVVIDQKYPQAIWISTIMQRLGVFGNSPWEIIPNDDPRSPFFTSDFPAAIESVADGQILSRIVPLAPDFAVKIHPLRSAKRLQDDLTFPGFLSKVTVPKPSDVRAINQAVARCAEDLVFFRDQHDWVKPFLIKNAGYRVETIEMSNRLAGGIMNVFATKIVAR